MRKKILVYADSPNVKTGFGTVSRNILEILYNTGKYDIDIFGINYHGIPHNFPYRIWPAMDPVKHDPYGRERFFRFALQHDFDILWVLQDTFIVDFLPPLISKLRETRKKPFKTVMYYPVDSIMKPEWCNNIKDVDKLVCYTEFGKEETLKHLDRDDIEVIYHGVNLKDFYPLPDDEVAEFRSRYFGAVADNFIFMNVNRNQQRKDIPRTIMAFNEFRKKVPNSTLYLHMAEVDQGWNLPELCKYFGFSDKLDVVYPQNFEPNQAYPVEVLNMLYNCVDCVVSTTLGEGFGLCLMPDTAVHTDSGVKEIKDVTITDKVLSSDGTYNAVEAIMTKEHSGDIYSITTWMSNIPIKSSPEHGFLVCRDNTYTWKQAIDLKVGDNLVFPKKYKVEDDVLDIFSLVKKELNIRQINNIVETDTHFRVQSNFTSTGVDIPKKIKITKPVMKLFGLFLAEGSVGASKMDSIAFSFHKDETDLQDFVKKYMKEVFNVDTKYMSHKSRGEDYKGQTLVFYSSVLAYLFKTLFGCGARNKFIHSKILNQPKDLLKELLLGEFLGDGSYSNTTYEFTFSTTSKNTAYALRLIMARMGVISSVRTSRVEYKVTVSGSSKRLLLDMFDIDYDKTRDWDKGFDKAGQNEDFVLLPIKDISKQNYSGKLIDIQVANTNDFVAHNAVVHNSWIEGLACNKPIIVPNNTAMKELLDDDKAYLVKSGNNSSMWVCIPHDNEVLRPLTDVEDMVDKMLEVYNNREEAKNKATLGRDWVLSNLDWKGSIAESWRRIFDEVSKSLDEPVTVDSKHIKTEVF